MTGGPWYVDRKGVMGMVAIKEEKFSDGSYREDDPVVALMSSQSDAEWLVEMYNVARHSPVMRGEWIGRTGGVATTDVREPNRAIYQVRGKENS